MKKRKPRNSREKALLKYWKQTPYELRREKSDFISARAELKARGLDYSPEEIAFRDRAPHMKSRKQAKAQYTAALNLGYDIDEIDILNEKIWDSVDKDVSAKYQQLKAQGYTSTEAAQIISQLIYGSE